MIRYVRVLYAETHFLTTASQQQIFSQYEMTWFGRSSIKICLSIGQDHVNTSPHRGSTLNVVHWGVKFAALSFDTVKRKLLLTDNPGLRPLVTSMHSLRKRRVWFKTIHLTNVSYGSHSPPFLVRHPSRAWCPPSFTAAEFPDFMERKIDKVRQSTVRSPPPTFETTDCAFNAFKHCTEERIRKIIGEAQSNSFTTAIPILLKFGTTIHYKMKKRKK